MVINVSGLLKGNFSPFFGGDFVSTELGGRSVVSFGGWGARLWRHPG